MTPIDYFRSAWERCNQLAAIYSYLEPQLTNALKPDELLRAEWVARVSALDLYIHEKVAQKMLEIFEGRRAPPTGFLRFEISNDALMRIRAAASSAEQSSAFELEIRGRLGLFTYQTPEKIAEGIRLVSDIELWNEIALKLGASPASKINTSKTLKRELSLIVERRNKIAHEGDLQPGVPRIPWPIDRNELQYVAEFIHKIVHAIEQIV